MARGASGARDTGGPRYPVLSRRLRYIAGNLALVAASCLVALLLGEVLVRFLAPQQLIVKRPDVWRPLDTLGWAHRPQVDAALNTGERKVRFVTDARGFRVGLKAARLTSRRVLLLGDSFMEAMQVEYERSTAGLLEAGLTERLGTPVAISNAAVAGWDPPQYLLQARSTLGQERFDLVLVALYLGNDVVPRRVERYSPRPPAEVHPLRFPRRLSARELVDAVAYPLNDILEVRSQLYIFLKRRAEGQLMRLGLTAEYFPAELLRAEATSPRWQITADICRDIAEVARERGTPTLFLLLPTPFQVDSTAFWTFVRGFGIDPHAVDLDQPNQLLARELAARGLRAVDVLSTFRDAQRQGLRVYGRVDRHFTPEGHQLLERELEPIVAAYLERRGDVMGPSRAGPAVADGAARALSARRSYK